MTIGFYLLSALAPFGSSIVGVLWILIAFVVLKHRGMLDNRFGVKLEVFWRLLYSLLGLSVLSALLSPNIGLSLLNVFGQFLMVAFGIIGASWLIERPELKDRLLAVGTISVALSAMVVLFNSVDSVRAATLFVGVNKTGTLLVLFGGLSLTYLWAKPQKWCKIGGTILYCLLLSAVLATGSRGALLGYLGMSFILLGTNKKTFMLFLLILVLATVFIASDDYYRDRFTRFSIAKNMDRVYIWQASVKMIEDKPYFGIGPGQFPIKYKEYKVSDESRDWYAYAHNIFLQIGAEYGVLALLVFTAFIFMVQYYGFRLSLTGNLLYKGLFASFVGVMIHQQVDVTAWEGNIGSLFWLLIGLIAAAYAKETTKLSDDQVIDRKRTVTGQVLNNS